MTKRILPTPEQLRQLLRYDPETGKMFWLPRPREMFPTQRSFNTWNSRFAGKEAFTAITKEHYRFGTIFGHPFRAHRVAWAIYYGKWPDEFIDHKNGDTEDNRLENLREASNAENMQNAGRPSHNTSGYKGVSFYKPYQKWKASIRAFGKQVHLGYFDAPESAHAAYCEAAKQYHGEFARVE